MPEPVDRPAPERTSTPPSASSSASGETPTSEVGTAVTGPWSLPASRCARRSPGGTRALQNARRLPTGGPSDVGRRGGEAVRGAGAAGVARGQHQGDGVSPVAGAELAQDGLH